jgi:NitT/TauT family transport system substrate-binding protein
VLQQLAAGSIDATVSAALIEPIYAISKGAPIRLVRLEIQLPPYAIEAKPQVKTLEDLRGKTVMVDAPTGITKIYSCACWCRTMSIRRRSTMSMRARPGRASTR